MSNARILVVEDDAALAAMVEVILSNSGYDPIAVVSSGEEVTRMADEVRPDLVLMDIMLPGGKDGIAIADDLRSRLDIPVVFLTALEDDETLERVYASDPFGYVPKPFTPNHLKAAIEIALHRYEMSSQLEESEARYRSLFDNAQDAILITDPETGMIVEANQALQTMLGRSLEELKQMSLWDIVAPGEVERGKDRLRQVVEEDHLDPREYHLLSSDGRHIPIEVRANIVQLGGRKMAMGFVRDITQRVQVERALRESEEKYRTLVEESLQGITILQDDCIVFSNPGMAEITGYTVEEMTSFSAEEAKLLVHPEDDAMVWKNVRNRFAGRPAPSSYEMRIVRKDGTPRWLEIVPTIIEYQGRPAAQIFSVDITDRKQAQEALLQRNRELELLNRAARAFSSSLELDEVLSVVLDEIRRLLDVTACSIWLIDSETNELTCRQAVGLGKDVVQGCTLMPGEGVVGWVAHHKRSLIVPDTRTDERHYKGVDRSAEMESRSIMAVLLHARDELIGVIEVIDSEPDRFLLEDQRLVESLASSAAIAIENARLYARNQQLVIKQERRRLAQQLHDTVTQSLYSIGMAAQTTLKLLGEYEKDEKIRGPVEHIVALSQSGLTEMREQLSNLYPSILAEKGLAGVLEELCNELKTRYLISVAFTVASEPELSMFQQETLYYIARETLGNSLKHANAKSVAVSLSVENSHVILSIEDDGSGFDTSLISLEKTFGLKSMTERARHIGGTLELDSRPGEGTRVVVRVPIRPQETI